MKKLNKITCAMLLFLPAFWSCTPPEYDTDSTFRLMNKTDVILTIKFYYNKKTYLDSIIILPNEVSDEFIECSRPHCDQRYFLFGDVDSVDIISYKDNNILRRYHRSENNIGEKNPFNINYYNFRSDDYSGGYIYAILNSDF